ncbi:hypothetical protein RBU49_17335 [Clostridium sp. MB40-C1]|uniref:hypothetical protein n=1 Tax=Clostridium sp. MB40-C1 TaxID=3070996 RepID=UPI0027E0079E|nr:hypothetical protein [Clostridium sp. MB40-C1]WMJ80542.1 hypothetical protein RBU49_17335 [Clostridium sp. MB40-C1]
MSEALGGYYPNDPENALEAKAGAFAYNKNCNIQIAPNTVRDDVAGANNSDKGESSNLPKEGLEELIKKFIGDGKEYETESKASGKAEIENVNLNFIITI